MRDWLERSEENTKEYGSSRYGDQSLCVELRAAKGEVAWGRGPDIIGECARAHRMEATSRWCHTSETCWKPAL